MQYGGTAPLLASEEARSRMPRGMLKYAVLFLLSERDTHGYELLQLIKERRWGAPGPGSVYPLLGALESGGLIRGHEDDGRRVYSITEEGRKTLSDHARRVHELTTPQAAQEQSVESSEEVRLRASASKLMQTVLHMNEASAPQALGKICDLLDDVRREIYAVLARE